MAKITLDGIVWSDAPDSAKVVQVAYRLTSSLDVESSYIIVSTSTLADIDGSFLESVEIGDLNIDESYTVRVISTCGGYSAQRVFSNDPSADAAYSYGYSLGFKS